jgi:acetyl-CoA C-acetyltransferase
MLDTVICAPVRTAVGRYGGVLKDVQAASLGAAVISAVVKRTGVDPELIDDVIFGQCYPNGEAPALGRVAALDAGLPVEVPGVQLDRRCGSGLQAVIWAVMQVQTGASDVVLAGGAESMSQVEFYSPSVRWGPGGEQIVFHDRLGRARVTAGGIHHPVPGGMLETAENLRREYQISRAEQDEFALQSHRRAVAAQDAGRFNDEIVPVEVTGRRGASTVVDRDEHPRADTSRRDDQDLRASVREADAGGGHRSARRRRGGVRPGELSRRTHRAPAAGRQAALAGGGLTGRHAARAASPACIRRLGTADGPDP